MLNLQMTELIGYVAALLTTLAFLPQALHSWRTRDLSGVSLPMYVMFTTGVGFWLVYGFLIASLPVILANAVTLLLAFMVLWLKISHVKNPQ